jgi:hypothetical protein
VKWNSLISVRKDQFLSKSHVVKHLSISQGGPWTKRERCWSEAERVCSEFRNLDLRPRKFVATRTHNPQKRSQMPPKIDKPLDCQGHLLFTHTLLLLKAGDWKNRQFVGEIPRFKKAEKTWEISNFDVFSMLHSTDYIFSQRLFFIFFGLLRFLRFLNRFFVCFSILLTKLCSICACERKKYVHTCYRITLSEADGKFWRVTNHVGEGWQIFWEVVQYFWVGWTNVLSCGEGTNFWVRASYVYISFSRNKSQAPCRVSPANTVVNSIQRVQLQQKSTKSTEISDTDLRQRSFPHQMEFLAPRSSDRVRMWRGWGLLFQVISLKRSFWARSLWPGKYGKYVPFDGWESTDYRFKRNKHLKKTSHLAQRSCGRWLIKLPAQIFRLCKVGSSGSILLERVGSFILLSRNFEAAF